MQIFISIVHRLRTNNVNVYVSKIYRSELIFGRRGVYILEGGLVFGMLNRLHIQGTYIPGGLINRGRINEILRYVFFKNDSFEKFLSRIRAPNIFPCFKYFNIICILTHAIFSTSSIKPYSFSAIENTQKRQLSSKQKRQWSSRQQSSKK